MPEDVWGTEVSIDLKDCIPDAIRDDGSIIQFVLDLCELIKVKPHGKCMLVRFGASPRVAGYSMVQLIDASLISGHFVEETNAAYLNVFSCRSFDPWTVVAFARDWFGAKSLHYITNHRML